MHTRSSLENHTRFQTKMGKVYTRFQTKTVQNPTRRGSTYAYGLYKEVPPGLVIKARQACRGKNKICAGKDQEHVICMKKPQQKQQ